MIYCGYIDRVVLYQDGRQVVSDYKFKRDTANGWAVTVTGRLTEYVKSESLSNVIKTKWTK